MYGTFFTQLFDTLCVTGHAEVAGGVSFVQQTLATCKPQTVATTMVVDLHCYDGWPCLAVLKDD